MLNFFANGTDDHNYLKALEEFFSCYVISNKVGKKTHQKHVKN